MKSPNFIGLLEPNETPSLNAKNHAPSSHARLSVSRLQLAVCLGRRTSEHHHVSDLVILNSNEFVYVY